MNNICDIFLIYKFMSMFASWHLDPQSKAKSTFFYVQIHNECYSFVLKIVFLSFQSTVSLCSYLVDVG